MEDEYIQTAEEEAEEFEDYLRFMDRQRERD